jgi:hypothetical protein
MGDGSLVARRLRRKSESAIIETMIAFNDQTDSTSLPRCPLCGSFSDCGTGHASHIYYNTLTYSIPASTCATNHSFYAPPATQRRFRASAIGRRYIPATLDDCALSLIEVEQPWRRPITRRRDHRARIWTRTREVAPLRSRPGRH